MASVIIVGGGPAGLAAALFSARRGHCVTVIEPDLPPLGQCGADVVWRRRGVGHAQHGHLFLARSSRVLQEEAPDLLAAVLRHGCLEVPLVPADGVGMIIGRRLVYEGAIRLLVEQESGITMVSGARVVGLLSATNGSCVPRVTGVRTSDGQRIVADLVVDACGRFSPSRRWLEEIGSRQAAETSHRCGFVLVNRQYRARSGQPFPRFRLPLVAALSYAAVTVFPADHGFFSITVLLAASDPYRRRIHERAVFDRFLMSVPLAASWVTCGDPVDDPQPVTGLVNRWRRLIDDRGPVVAGLALIGDAALQTSPTLGRGVSLAFVQAQLFARTVDDTGGETARFTGVFDAVAAKHLAVWYNSQVVADRVRNAQLEAGMRGEMLQPVVGSLGQLQTTLWNLRDEDPEIRAAYDRVFNLLDTPQETIRSAPLRRGLHRALGGGGTAPRDDRGPTRAEFERLVAC